MRLPVSVFGKRLLQWLIAAGLKRWLRGFAKFCSVAAIPIVALYIIEPAIGERMWRNYQAEAAAKGVKLRYEEYETPSIPDEENYAAAPIFQKALASPDGARDTETLFTLPSMGGVKVSGSKGQSLLLKQRQQSFLKRGWIEFTSPEPASDVLMGLVRLSEPLDEIRKASSRPRTRWPIQWTPETRFPLNTRLQEVAVALMLRANALLCLDRTDEALDEVRHIMRIAESLQGLPSELSILIRAAICNMALLAAEEGIRTNRWRESQLIELADEFQKVNLLADWKQALSSGRCFMNYYFERVAAASTLDFRKEYVAFAGEKTAAILLWPSPKGWLRRNQVEFNEILDLDLADIDAEHERIRPQYGRSLSLLNNQTRWQSLRVSRHIATHWMPNTVSSTYHICDKQTHMRQLTILCALARYRNDHGALPASLKQLIPDYLNVIPHDIMDGKPMRYRRTDEGGCILWSIGANRFDEGGTRGKGRIPSAKQPDWVTELPPLTNQ